MDTTCSICLEYLMDPVTISCGHSFCRACISHCWEPGTQDHLCPVCWELCAQHVVVPNRQLASVVEITKQLHSGKCEVKVEPLCPRPHKGLHFFCKEDQEAVCLVCAVSHGNRGHSEGPLEDAVKEYKSKLQDCQLQLDVKLQKVNNYISAKEKRPKELRELVKSCHQHIVSEFEELPLLEEKKEMQLWRLKAEEAEILEKLKDHMALLSEKRLSLSKLITDMGEKCLEWSPEMLRNVRSIMQRGHDCGS
ncbi:unnamed protein product [Natator depressus]